MYQPTTSCGQIGLILHKIYHKFLGYKTNGTFIEVGANDGKTGSFTYNLAKLDGKVYIVNLLPNFIIYVFKIIKIIKTLVV